jgi:aryl-alcohol dehydrogenase-like predicted oxidoreductase/NAD-dependent dihydropyrimidine dehydrogenase PreA subunit
LEYRKLGNTGIEVSRLCFGALTIGPLQANLSPEEGGKVIRYALEQGVNFIDTAQLYGTYEHIRLALEDFERETIIVSKSYAVDYDEMKKAVEEARKKLQRDVVDIFMLHEQESGLTLKGHRRALDYLVEAKSKGYIRAIGISTHATKAVHAAALLPEIDVIHPLINLSGIGILDGTREEMEEATEFAASLGKGLYAMKALGGGSLIPKAKEAFEYILDKPHFASVAVGMRRISEVDLNLKLFSSKIPKEEEWQNVATEPRKLHIDYWCIGCGACARRCRQGAIKIINGKAVVDHKKCVRCAYCASVCPEFAIKVV